MVTTVQKRGGGGGILSPRQLVKSWKVQIHSFLKQRFDRSALRIFFWTPFWKRGKLAVLTRQDLVANPGQYHLLPFGRAHHHIATPPITLEPSPSILQPMYGEFTLEQPFVAELQDVQLVGKSALAITRDRQIVMESVLPNRDSGMPGLEGVPLRTLVRRETTRFQAPQTLDTVCSLITPWSHVYTHWLCESLTRLEGAEYYAQQTGRKPTLLLHQNPKKWQIESLKLLGYDLEDFVQWQGGRVHVDRLVLPSFRRQRRWSDPDAYQWMRDRMLQNVPPETDLEISPRIVISRGNADGRRIVNRDEMMEVLAPLGFKSYVTDSLSFADEVRLFSQAEVVIGTHGSGFANIIFSNRKPVVIDLYSSWFCAGFFQLATSMGGTYACLSCEPRGINAGLKNSDMWVDVARLKTLLQKVLSR